MSHLMSLQVEHGFFLNLKMRFVLWKNSFCVQKCGAQITALPPAC